jgi:glycosyltransferase involved in cell wall biosynthesis
MMHRLGDLMRAASSRIAICDAMADEYGRRWGNRFAAIHNAVDGERWRPFQRTCAASSGRGDLLYVGSIAPFAQLNSLVDLCHAVQRLAARGERVTLTVASPAFQIAPVRHLLEIGPSIRIVPPIEDDEQFYRRIAEADGLVLPVNFDADSIRFIRYSMPTKVPAYLFSGTPILVYGPDKVAQVSYAAKEGWGLVVDRRDETALDGAITALLGDEALRAGLAQAGIKLARERHDVHRVRQSFQSLLCEAA